MSEPVKRAVPFPAHLNMKWVAQWLYPDLSQYQAVHRLREQSLGHMAWEGEEIDRLAKIASELDHDDWLMRIDHIIDEIKPCPESFEDIHLGPMPPKFDL